MAARIGAHSRWAKEPDRKSATAPARRGWLARFEQEVDPDGVLNPVERERRARHAMSAHMTRLALAREANRRARTGRTARSA
jgi:hypothetical protein